MKIVSKIVSTFWSSVTIKKTKETAFEGRITLG